MRATRDNAMTVSASLFVDTNPSVLAAGGADLVLNGVFLTTSVIPPLGTVQQFTSAAAVQSYFGAGSTEATIATIYFTGWSNSLQKPENMVFVQYPQNPVAAYLRGGNISAVPLATLQGYNGTLTIVLDGASYSGSVNLSGATSFSNAASLIATALNTSPPTEASFTGSISGTTLTVPGTVTGVPLSVGHNILGSGITAGTQITGILGPTTFTVNNSQSIGSEAMTATATVTVTYASVQGGFKIVSGITGASSTAAYPTTNTLATNLLLTAATSAVLSQGAAAAVPSAFMNNLINTFTNWASFTTTFDPDGGIGFANKQLFSNWTAGTNGRFAYAAWDTDPNAAAILPATGSYGYWLQQNEPNGTVLHWASDATDALELATFWMGAAASIDFDQTGGRITFAGKSNGLLTPTVLDNTSFTNLAGNPQAEGSFGNGYNCYAGIATANASFQWYQRSTISGPFQWSDAYINAIWWTNTGQLALMDLFDTANSIPFDAQGAGMIRTALMPLILQGLAFGMYAPGVTLSGTQIASVNASAGYNIASQLQNNGWALLVRPATASVRSNRGPWQVVFFYTDAGAVQSITLSTVALT
jgi:hypothetical protein